MAYRLYPYPVKLYIFKLETFWPNIREADIRISVESSDTNAVYEKAFDNYDTGDTTIPTAKVSNYGGGSIYSLEDCRIHNNTPYVLHVQCWEKGHHANMDSGSWEADVPAGQDHNFDLNEVDQLDGGSYALITVKGFPSDYVYNNLEPAVLKKI